LGTALPWEVFEVTDSDRVINYGLDKVRFPSPVPSGSAVEMAVDLVAVEQFTGGLALPMVWTLQIPGSPKPACVAEAIFRYYGVPENGRVGVDSADRHSAGHKPPA
jgi:acyl dehydratase